MHTSITILLAVLLPAAAFSGERAPAAADEGFPYPPDLLDGYSAYIHHIVNVERRTRSIQFGRTRSFPLPRSFFNSNRPLSSYGLRPYIDIGSEARAYIKLLKALKADDIPTVRQMIERNKASVFWRHIECQPLWLFIRTPEMLQAVFEAEGQVDIDLYRCLGDQLHLRPRGGTALHFFVARGETALVRKCLQLGANPSAFPNKIRENSNENSNKDQCSHQQMTWGSKAGGLYTPLQAAVWMNNPELVALLLPAVRRRADFDLKAWNVSDLCAHVNSAQVRRTPWLKEVLTPAGSVQELAEFLNNPRLIAMIKTAKRLYILPSGTEHYPDRRSVLEQNREYDPNLIKTAVSAMAASLHALTREGTEPILRPALSHDTAMHIITMLSIDKFGQPRSAE